MLMRLFIAVVVTLALAYMFNSQWVLIGFFECVTVYAREDAKEDANSNG